MGCERTPVAATDDAAPAASSVAPPPASIAPATAARSAAPPAKMEPNFVCRSLARELTAKACGCPQKNQAGCCFFGSSSLECSKGRTDWPSVVENRLCDGADADKKLEALTRCYSARDRLVCGRTAQGDLGARLPNDCEPLFAQPSK
jgi:hypothetical protein